MIQLLNIFDDYNINLFDGEDLGKLLFKFAINFFFAFIIIRLLYYPSGKKREFLFSYFLINILVFVMCALLKNVNLDTGFALGLFAVFGIIRYRTEAIPIKEMTYLFTIIGIGVINALWNKKVSVAEVVSVNIIVIIVTFAVERLWFIKSELTKMISYEKIELIKPENHPELMDDLEARTGLNINSFEVMDVNFLNDTAKIKISYYNEDLKSSKYTKS